MIVLVTKVSIPPMSTVGHGWGYSTGNCGKVCNVHFVGDQRPMRDLGEAIEWANKHDEDPPVTVVEEWQSVSATEAEPLDSPQEVN